MVDEVGLSNVNGGRFDHVTVKVGAFRPYFWRSSAFSTTSESARRLESVLRSWPTEVGSAGALIGSTSHQPSGPLPSGSSLSAGELSVNLRHLAEELDSLDLVGGPGENLTVAEGERVPWECVLDRVRQGQDRGVADDLSINRLATGIVVADPEVQGQEFFRTGRGGPERIARVSDLPDLEGQGRLGDARIRHHVGIGVDVGLDPVERR